MDRSRILGLSLAICLVSGAAHAQPSDNAKTNTPRAGPGYTNGYGLMTPEERRNYQATMNAMTIGSACRAFVEEHHRQMVRRANESGVGIPPAPRFDVCDGLPY